MIKTPQFWNDRGVKSTAISFGLLPLSALWIGLSALRHAITKTSKADLPVICIGNITAGGTGKTPLVGLLYDELLAAGHNPAILTRGYGGSDAGPLWVDGTVHDATICGDEPLMLAEGRDVLVARDRVSGAYAIASRGIHDLILMDDGMQNPFLAKDIKIGVFDGEVGIGNGQIIPAGPLREAASSGIAQLDMVVINGDDETGLADMIPSGIPVFIGSIIPDQSVIDDFDGAPLLGFAGIARPQRFFATLRRTGANLVQWLAFADHHPFSQTDLTTLHHDAIHQGAQLITTKKDWVRLPSEWRDKVTFLPVTMELAQKDEIVGRIIATIAPDASSTGDMRGNG